MTSMPVWMRYAVTMWHSRIRLTATMKGVDERVPGNGEDLEALKQRRILIDGAPMEGQGILLQIFTGNVIGPIFFEIIQRKGNAGFGEGNFQALFESIEQDQVRRGVLGGEGDGINSISGQ